MKESVIRGSRKRFQTTITDLEGNPQDPDVSSCYVRLEKTGTYTHDSPTRWYPCKSVGSTGEWGADIWLPNWMTLGDWLARFRWLISTVEDFDSFEFTVIRRDKPWIHTAGPKISPVP